MNMEPHSNAPISTPMSTFHPDSGPLTVILPPDLPANMHPHENNSNLMPPPSVSEPPQYFHINTMSSEEIPPPKLDFSAPPPYETATKLPTYEEVQREKSMQGEIPDVPPATVHRPQTYAFFAIDAEAANQADADSGLLGTDVMFFAAFLVAFLFNWVGFLLFMCFCRTVAARYGALAGFGLSLAKWTLIVKNNTEFASTENSWLWWLIMAFGILICIRAIIQYLNIKRGWRLLSGTAQERLLFFY